MLLLHVFSWQNKRHNLHKYTFCFCELHIIVSTLLSVLRIAAKVEGLFLETLEALGLDRKHQVLVQGRIIQWVLHICRAREDSPSPTPASCSMPVWQFLLYQPSALL